MDAEEGFKIQDPIMNENTHTRDWKAKAEIVGFSDSLLPLHKFPVTVFYSKAGAEFPSLMCGFMI